MDEFLKQLTDVSSTLVQYGPYALAALFLLYLAPKHSKRFTDYHQEDNKKQNFLLIVAIGNWLVALVMCFYIYVNWSPITTYQGALGLHSEDSSFFTVDANSYIASQEEGDSLDWNFAFIASVDNAQSNKHFKFIHQYKGEFMHYKIPLSLLKKGYLEIATDPDNPSRLIYLKDDQTSSALEPVLAYQPAVQPQQFMAAYALTPEDSANIIKKLSSSNPRYQIIGQRKLRALAKVELEQLLNTPELSAQAKKFINNAISQR